MSEPIPIHPEKIDALRGVECHFQTDRNFKVTYSSSDESDLLEGLSSVCLSFALGIAEAGGFGSINELVAHAGNSKFALFSLNSAAAENPGPKSFGVKLAASTDLQEFVNSVNEIIQK